METSATASCGRYVTCIALYNFNLHSHDQKMGGRPCGNGSCGRAFGAAPPCRYKGAFDSFCWSCGWGQYAEAGSAGCQSCPAGTSASVNRTHCDPCESGKYSPSTGSGSCYECSWAVVSADMSKCEYCPAGKSMKTGTPNYCEDCSPGRYGSVSYWSGGDCLDCPLGRYSNETGLSQQCSACPGLATAATASQFVENCIQPTANQSFECPKGKPCSVSGLQGSGLQNGHRLMIKYETCESDGAPTESTGVYSSTSGTSGGFGYGRRLQTSGTAVTGFGYEGWSLSGSTDYSWEGSLEAEVGVYRLCWCGGVTSSCGFDYDFPVDAGSMTVTGPFPNQQFACVLGRFCRNVGPLLGLGLDPQDQIHIRERCVAELAFVISIPLTIAASSSGDDVSLYVSRENSATQEVAGEYALCWCSFKGQDCSDMQISESAVASGNLVYLESEAGTLVIQGPAGGESIYCYKGQTCPATLSNGGTTLLAGDRLSFMQQCGGDFLAGLPTPGFAETQDGSSFSFLGSTTGASIQFLESEPGMFRVCWCRADASMNMDCQKGSDFNVVAGLFLAVGPYSGQTRQCTHGQQCVITGLRGVSMSATDKLTPLASCANALVSQTFPSWPPPLLSSSLDASTGSYQFDLGQLDLEGVPEELQLCWCGGSPSGCSDPAEYRAVAVTVSVACASGWYELRGNRTVCRRCLPGYYCHGGWPADLLPCPAGKTSVANSSTSSACECREGYQWDAAGLCNQCASGSFKNFVGNDACNGTCPTGTTSSVGATRVSQCYCEGEGETFIDTDPGTDSFTCTDLNTLSANISGSTLVATQAVVSSFTGSLMVLDASTEALARQIDEALLSYLGFGGEAASKNMQPGWNGVWFFNYSIITAEQSLATEARGKLDPEVFAAWVFTEMRGTPLDSAYVSTPSLISRGPLQCPQGLGIPGGTFVSSRSDCKCPYGMQPNSGSSGTDAAGCMKCPVGKYSSAMSDLECTQCVADNAVLTTLSEGAISQAACTCSAGFVNLDPANPSECQECGLGSFCLGGTHRQQCGESQTTTGAVSTSEDQCLCAAGFFNENLVCKACDSGRFKPEVANTLCAPCAAGNFSGMGQSQCDICDAGRYSTGGAAACELCSVGRYLEATAATSSDACLPCPVGKWSNITGLSVASGCVACVTGSTTVLDGAATESMCVQPDPVQTHTCTSGWVCVVQGVTGVRLQDGHRLAITTSDCASAKSPVTGIANNGISKLATGTGSSYVWGDSISDFTPQGGFANLCWCANIGELTCEGLNSNFWLSAGTLLMVGPVENTFVCVRGRDCLDLQPFSGHGISAEDHVRIQRDSCGAASAVEISVANQAGTGSFQLVSSAGNFVQLSLGFGQTDAENDFHVQIDASQAGYLLCWCGSKGSSTACANPADYVVYAGRLSVLGPSTNQEKGCAVGQACDITGVLGASVVAGDRLMILSDCGRGSAILGIPAQGILDTADGTDFAFAGDGAKILLSVPGIFRICFCRPITGIEACDSSSGFKARVGLMTASGPFVQSRICDLGSGCVVTLSGVGLAAGDQLWVADGECGQAASVAQKGFVDLENPMVVQESTSGLTVDLGTLPFGALPGTYQLCWCPQTADCSSTALFRAPAGSLQTNCPPGSFAVGPVSGWELKTF